MPQPEFAPQIASLRAFNRFYTRKIGVIDGSASNPFSLSEARVLFELAHRKNPTATDIRLALGLDAGYLSRILRHLERQHLVFRERSSADERQKALSLTAKGKRAFAALNQRSERDIAAILEELPPSDRNRLVHASETIRSVLGDKPPSKTPYLLRTYQPGDLGWIVSGQALLYVEEYGWDGSYEALAAEIVAQFIKNFDPKREQCWIAEMDGERVGGVFIAKASDQVAKLRLLHVEQSARGLGIGKRLVEECVRFSRRAGYEKISLWTQSILTAARHIYKQAGFQLIKEEKHHSFGKDLVGETWELELKAAT